MTLEGAISDQGSSAGNKQVEPEIVVAADAIVDPDTVMVLSLDTSLAEGTVFGAGGLGELTGATEVAWMEETIIIGVGADGRLMVLVCNVGGGGACEVKKQIGGDNQEGDGELLHRGESVPGGGDE